MLLLLPLPINNIIYGSLVGLILIPIVQFFIVITSILYWTNVNNIYYKILDILVVKIGIIIHFSYCYTYGCIFPALLMCLTILTYLLGRYFNSNLIHSFVWIFGYLGNYLFISNFEKIMLSK